MKHKAWFKINNLNKCCLGEPSESANRLLFCHGDLNPSNIIYDPTRGTIVFIDLEFSGPNFQVILLQQCSYFDGPN